MTGQQQAIAFHHVLYLMLSLAMVTAPHSLHLPWWITALATALFAWRAYLGHARLALPNRGLMILIALAGLLGVFLTYTLAPVILQAALSHENIYHQVIDFLFIRIWGLPLLYLYVMRNALLVGTNQTRLLFWGTLSEAATNIFLDYSLIYGHFGFPALGFNGAAYASIVAEGVGLLVIYIIIHEQELHKRFSF